MSVSSVRRAAGRRPPPGPTGLSYDQAALPSTKPWTSETFYHDPLNFQLVIIGDRTDGANVQGTFELAMNQINLLQPDFVINVGDLVEGYSDEAAELSAEWDRAHARACVPGRCLPQRCQAPPAHAVETDRHSRFSADGACVRVAPVHDLVAMGDSAAHASRGAWIVNSAPHGQSSGLANANRHGALHYSTRRARLARPTQDPPQVDSPGESS